MKPAVPRHLLVYPDWCFSWTRAWLRFPALPRICVQAVFALGMGLTQAFDGTMSGPSLRRAETPAFAAPAASTLFSGVLPRAWTARAVGSVRRRMPGHRQHARRAFSSAALTTFPPCLHHSDDAYTQAKQQMASAC